jgi:hypothetical protein
MVDSSKEKANDIYLKILEDYLVDKEKSSQMPKRYEWWDYGIKIPVSKRKKVNQDLFNQKTFSNPKVWGGWSASQWT